MADAIDIYVQSVSEALKQVTTYSGIGLTSAMSAWLLDGPGRRAKAKDPVTVPFIAVALSADIAKRILIGIAAGFGAMALVAADSAARAMTLLQDHRAILDAACTYPSIATTSFGLRVASAALPPALVGHVLWRGRKDYSQNWLIIVAIAYAAIYGTLAFALVRTGCPDV